jgi:diguanylate cyclase (GGDEF)-like protein/PAS domain S-box-containing protein
VTATAIETRRATLRRSRAAFGLVLLAAVVSFAGAFAPSWSASVLRAVVGTGAVASLVVGIRLNRPRGMRAWSLMAVGLGLWVFGDMVWDWLAWRGIDVPANTHWADALYLGGYLATGAAFVGLIRARSGARSRDGMIDGSVLALAGVILVWILLVAPQQVEGTPTIDALILAGYPLADGVLLAAIAWLILTPGRRCTSMYLLSGGLLLMFGADLLWNLAVRFEVAWDVWLNPMYPTAYALIAAAALHPSVVALTEPATTTQRHVHPARLAFLGIALFAGPLITLAADGGLGTADLMVVGCSLAVAALVVARFVSLVRDNERAHAATAASEQRFRLLASSAPVGIYEVGSDLRIAFANEEARRLFGRDVVGVPAGDLLDQVEPADREAMVHAAEMVIAGERADAEFRLQQGDDDRRWVSWHGVPIPHGDVDSPLAFASTLDITALKEAEATLARQATHDMLTGLPNRRLLADRLAAALHRVDGTPGGGTLAVMFIDLDRFKLVNDLLGHDAGDALLIQISQRIRGALRPRDTVARFGGDEFVALIEHVADLTELADIAGRLITAVEVPVAIPDGTIDIGASIGIAIARGPDDDAEALMRDADVAMYRAKSLGRGRYQFFDPKAHTEPAGGTVSVEDPRD